MHDIYVYQILTLKFNAQIFGRISTGDFCRLIFWSDLSVGPATDRSYVVGYPTHCTKVKEVADSLIRFWCAAWSNLPAATILDKPHTLYTQLNVPIKIQWHQKLLAIPWNHRFQMILRKATVTHVDTHFIKVWKKNWSPKIFLNTHILIRQLTMLSNLVPMIIFKWNVHQWRSPSTRIAAAILELAAA